MHLTSTPRSPHCRSVASLALLLGGFMLSPGCEEHEDTRAKPVEAIPAPTVKRAALMFPESLRVKEAPVNALLEKAMRYCSEGDYESFRLIWTARQEPIARNEFHRGWEAMKEIRIRALERVALATPIGGQAEAKRDAGPETVYVAYAEMKLDQELIRPAEGRRDSDVRSASENVRRDAVLMIVKELGEWRLAHAPKNMRSWVREKFASTSPTESSEAEDTGGGQGGG